jgi:hypothetical protein
VSEDRFICKFNMGDSVLEIATDKRYVILLPPDPNDLLVHCMEPFYKYVDVSNGKVLNRCVSEMDDGRFIFLNNIMRNTICPL